jgi:outer membrane protein assembly factor BamB
VVAGEGLGLITTRREARIMKKQLFAGLGCMCLALLVTAQTQAATSVSLKWSFAMGKPVGKDSDAAELSSPTIGADGTIYVGSTDGKVYALNPDGSQRWSFATEQPVYTRAAIGADGTIYLGSGDKKVYALNRDGSQKWSFLTGGKIYASPAIGADGTIYVTASDHRVYAIKPQRAKK